jgi:hemolysin III
MKLFKFVPDEIPKGLEGNIKSIPEEIANMVSHGIGWIFFLCAVPALLFKANQTGNVWYFIGCLVFGISLMMVYTSSTLYHSYYKDFVRKRLRVFDHISIYFLITGSFTPFILVHLQTSIGWFIFGVLWSMVLIGSVFKYFFTHKYNLVATLAYVGMGCMAFFIINPLYASISDTSATWLSLGGLSYLIGVVFYLWKNLKFGHFIWHIFVLLGSFSHFMAVWYLY